LPGIALRIAGDPVGELGESRLRDDDRARGFQVLRQRGFVGRDIAGEHQRAAGRRHVGGVDVVLERDRDAVQRSAELALRALAIERVGLGERVRIDGQCGVEPIFVHRNPDQVLLDQLARGDLLLRHRLHHLRDGRLDHGEAPLLPLHAERECRHQQRENEGGSFHARYSSS
jgi:hypothetical protein